MVWTALGRVALRLVATAVGLTESSLTSKQGDGKLQLAMDMVGQLATGCQDLSPAGLLVLGVPEVRKAMEAYAKARVDLENAVARAQAEVRA